MARFTCMIAFPDRPTIQNVAATFGREGDHLVTDNPEDVKRHIEEVAHGDPRLKQFHRLTVDGNTEYWLMDVGDISPEGTISWPEREH